MGKSSGLKNFAKGVIVTGLVASSVLTVKSGVDFAKSEKEYLNAKKEKIEYVEKESSSDAFKAYLDYKCDTSYNQWKNQKETIQELTDDLNEYGTSMQKIFANPKDGKLQDGEEEKVEEYLKNEAFDDTDAKTKLETLKSLQEEETTTKEASIKDGSELGALALATTGLAIGLKFACKHQDSPASQEDDFGNTPNQ